MYEEQDCSSSRARRRRASFAQVGLASSDFMSKKEEEAACVGGEHGSH